MLSDEELRLLYGADAVISRKGRFTLIHLDRPTDEVVEERTSEFDPDDFFCPECPLCEMLSEGGVVVYDDSIYESDDEDELEE